MISSGNSSVGAGASKCLKNLDIVMESADEGQALLQDNPNNTTTTSISAADGIPDGEGTSSSSSAEQQQPNQTDSVQVQHAQPSTTMLKMKLISAISDDDEENKLATLKGRKKANQQQQPSRVKRSRLSVITFLNNITAPATRTDGGGGKSWRRSLSVSTSSVQQQKQPHHSHTPSSTSAEHSQMESDKQKMVPMADSGTEKDGVGGCSASGHRLTKSLCGKATDELRHVHIDGTDGGGAGVGADREHGTTSSCAVNIEKGDGSSSGTGCCGGGMASIGKANGCVGNVMVADRLSIKSGASSTSSSGGHSHSESQCNLSVSKQMKARECPVCYIRQHPTNFHKLQTCSHLTCKACLVKYLNLEIMESRTNISCPNCSALLHASDIYALLDHQPELLDRYEMFSLRRALSTDPDARWCPAPDCTYAVIAYSCAACPQLKCERCDTMFCYHCKNNWHPKQTCDQARAKLTGGLRGFAAQATALMTDSASSAGDVTKACPRCGVQIMKMNDGSCNHMQCVLCHAEFCWLCLKQINELHYLSPTGCTFWGKKPWTRKKKLLWQIGTLIGAPLGIALIAGLAVPGIICGVPIFVGRKVYQRFENLSKMRRRFVTALAVFGSLIVSPVLAVLSVGVGVPVMLAYVYGVVPLSLCRNGNCGGSGGLRMYIDDDAYGERNEIEVLNIVETDRLNSSSSQNGKTMAKCSSSNSANNCQPQQQQREEEKTSNKSSFHHRRQSIASSGLVSLTDKVNTEDASIQAIAGSQYNFDGRSVHTVWSSGQCEELNDD
ncbi:hypothetical protein niasHT_000824 [Heterodera trifolii]|uniref:RBR-type E3 ubiquitin transferase n=1 Tax=Heterodera trifolii TaxID=157864 RepID=A0ABD2MA49_9BILA